MQESETTGTNNKEFFEEKFKTIYQEHFEKYQEKISKLKSGLKLPSINSLKLLDEKSLDEMGEKIREAKREFEHELLTRQVFSDFQGGQLLGGQLLDNPRLKEIRNKQNEIEEKLQEANKAVQEYEKKMKEILAEQAKKDEILSEFNRAVTQALKNDERIKENLIDFRVSGVIQAGPYSFERRNDLVLYVDNIDLKKNLSWLETQKELDIPTLAQTLCKNRSSISVVALPLENSFSGEFSTQDETDYRKALEAYCNDALRERSVLCFSDSEESKPNTQTQNEAYDSPQPSTSADANRFSGSLLFSASFSPRADKDKKDKQDEKVKLSH